MNLSLNIVSDPIWSYAYAGTRRPVVRGITLNLGDRLPDSDIEIYPRITFDFPLPEEVAPAWMGNRRIIESRGENIGQPISWDRIDFSPNYALLGRLLERVQGYICVEIVDASSDKVLVTERKPLAFMAPNEWYYEGNDSNSFHEVLAAFVLPSDPFVAEILVQARKILERDTGSSSTEGYQAEQYSSLPLHERSRASQIAKAIYEAMCSMGYSYSNPQGRLEKGGQRVRTPSQIKAEDCGTCLDTTVLMAACFAQAGLEPVLFLIEGHAFAGYLTGEVVADSNGRPQCDSGGNILIGDQTVRHWKLKAGPVLRKSENYQLIQKLLQEKHIQAVETTTTTTGSRRTFGEACMSQNGFDINDDSLLESIVFVSNAWSQGITPPVSLADVPLQGNFNPNAQFRRPLSDSDSDNGDAIFEADLELDDLKISAEDRATPPRVRQWMASLLDLSSRNPLLKIKPSQMIEFDASQGMLGKLDDLIYTPRNRIEIISPASLPFEWQLSGVTESDFERWQKAEGKLVSPSFKALNEISDAVDSFVKKVRNTPGHPNERLSDAELVTGFRRQELDELNAKLKKDITKVQKKTTEAMLSNGVNALYLGLGTMSWTETTSGRGNTSSVTWCAPLYLYPVILEGGKGSPFNIRLDPNGEFTPNFCLHEKLKRAPYNLDLQELINPEYDNLGLNFNKMMKAIEQRLSDAKLNNFAIQHRAFLGVFEYSTFRLWKDFKDSWQKMAEINPAAKHLIYSPNDPFLIEPTIPNPRLEPHLPIAADDSQIEAVQMALDGKSFRLEGPPGTGKSQTIANLLASCIANNKKVLFVAEKQTALDAVLERLGDVNLNKYCLNLHAKGDSDARIRRNITNALNSALAERLDPIDQPWQDNKFKLQSEELILDRYRTSLHGSSTAELSAWRANEELISIGSGETINLPSGFVTNFEAQWPALRELAFEIRTALDLVGDPLTHPWKMVNSFESGSNNYADLTQDLQLTIDAFSALQGCGDLTLQLITTATLDQMKILASALAFQKIGKLPSTDFCTELDHESWKRKAQDFVEESFKICSTASADLAAISPEIFESADIRTILEATREVNDPHNSASIQEVTSEWKNFWLSLQKSAAFISSEIFENDEIDKISRLMNQLDGAELKQLQQIQLESQDLETKIRQHVTNVRPSILERTDLLNIGLLLGDAKTAGVLSRGKKMRALREKLGDDAVAQDDRLLLLSLDSLLPLASVVSDLQGRLQIIFPKEDPSSFKPYISTEMSKLSAKFRSVRIASIRKLLGSAATTTDDAKLLTALQHLLPLMPEVERCRNLLSRSFPEINQNSYKPWKAMEIERFTTYLREIRLQNLKSVAGALVLTSDPEEMIRSLLSISSLLPTIERLTTQLDAELNPGNESEYRPWVESDVTNMQTLLETICDLGIELKTGDCSELFASILNAPDVNKVDVDVVSNALKTWHTFTKTFQLSPNSESAWLAGRHLVTAVNSDFPLLKRDGGANHSYLELSRWLSLLTSLDRLNDFGLQEFRDKFLNNEIETDEFLTQIRRSALSEAFRERMQIGNLDRFDRKIHERRIVAFESALKEMRSLLTQRIPGLVNQRMVSRLLPGGKSVGGAQDLLRGLKPVRGAKTPIRELITKYGEALSDAMPCFMMSPDSVATLVPVGSIEFDVVVFDEASQVRTSHAVGALGRGKAGIVVGDSRQMPPSSNFSSNSGAFVEDSEDDISADLEENVDDLEDISQILIGAAARDAESILTEFEESQFPFLQLLCHYRSRDELLIAFSNLHIYEKPMLTFPSVRGLDSDALRFVHLPAGNFERDKNAPPHHLVVDGSKVAIPSLRTNRIEAEAVVKFVIERLRDPHRIARRNADPKGEAESIIVVTFNIQQLNLITALLQNDAPDDYARAISETMEDEEAGTKKTYPQLKIKNLENVQGDQAETVIFSVAFSKKADGSIPLNWGPVTQSGGDRRLNVAVTRAQVEMVVFCSFEPDEMTKGSGGKKRSISAEADMVYKFLSLAKNGANKTGDIGIGVPRSKHIEKIAHELRQKNYEVQTQLGLSNLRVDIAVRRPGESKWTLAIMVDDSCWSERGSAYQREILPRQVLPSLGWAMVYRLWMPSWMSEREAILRDIDDFFEGNIIETEEPVVEQEEVFQPVPSNPLEQVERVQAIASPPTPDDANSFSQFTPFITRIIAGTSLLDEAKFDPAKKSQILALVDEILTMEAPIEAERFAKMVCNSLSFGRVSPDRVKEVLGFIPASQKTNDPIGSFIWHANQNSSTWQDYRVSLDAITREPDEISVLEYGNALIDIINRVRSISQEVATKEVARLFGFQRLTTKCRDSIEEAFRQSVTSRRVQLNEGEYRLPDK